ncbi:extracellular solute-binding protein [Bacillus sp. EB106-08-02-XG196]|uniref:extracellular solute-binding protein n=1 Tax=Bacillus sp. EB106-08-02-XG196 TaxID=2737049 RepID=UPI0015C429FF|nr:extracellular solute-binding protein [Bacillus sp. EB106-08-02-XG196]NWQ40766.1 extracellular solute-binding protein [Bacillus sp. EB106-08-02-XG196]
MAQQIQKSHSKRLLCIGLIIVLIISTMLPFSNNQSQTVYADENKNTKETASTGTFERNLEPYYHEMEQKWKSEGVNQGTDNLQIEAGSFSNKSTDAGVTLESYGGKDNVLLWSKPTGWVEYLVDVQNEGLYEIALEYTPLLQADGGTRQSVIFNVQLNGSYPYRESRSIELKREFRDEKPQYDDNGNQIRSLVKEVTGWKTEALRDSGGVNVEPLLFHLKKGENSIRLQVLRDSIALKSVEIKSPESSKTYQDVKETYPSNSSKSGKFITIEAEKFNKKNSTSIQVQYDRDPLTTPKSLKMIKFNTLGGANWYQGGQAVTWEFEVPENGIYKIGFRGLQNFRKNLSTFRTIYIDGQIPFEEMKHYQISYATGWQEIILNEKNGSPYSFYLDKGKHTLSLEATYEPFVPLVAQMDELANEIRAISQELRLASGNQEDQFRVWNVEEELPGLLDQLKTMKKQFEKIAKQMLEINGEQSNVSQALESIIQDISFLLEEPGEIPNSQVRIGALQDKLETQRQELMNSPLQVDKFFIAPDKTEFPPMTANWFEKINGTFNSLLYSFSDQNQLEQQSDKELNVWMMWGRDYAEELQQLANQQFTPKYGIKVNVNLIQDTNLLILAKAAGIMPDVALGVPSGMPFEMAVRGAAKDISTMPGAEELLKQYAPGTMLPYYYDGGTYGIPETINFKVLFYRKDILDQLQLEVPETWEDVYEMLPTLLQNHLNFFVDPKDFSYMLYQNDVELYTADGLKTGLDQPEAFQAFEEWTNLFNLHGMDRQVQSFYQQFRKGTFPIGIADFNQYMQLLVAAPEILDTWGIAPIPGHINESGENVRWAGGTGVDTTSMMLFNDTSEEKQSLAWEFIKWYSSPEVQTEYGLNLEQFRGETFRWNSANVQAFSKMPWREPDLQAILEQWQWVKDIANVPGGYMTTRQLEFAWNQTVLEGGVPRIELEKAIKAISRELNRKQSEFNLIDNNNKVLNPLDVPIITEPWEGVNQDEQ